MSQLRTCDICGKSIQPDNDLAQLLMMTDHFEHSEIPLFVPGQSRHILPAGECPGTPQIAQYLKDQPRAANGEYDSYLETILRAGYRQLTGQMFFCQPPELPDLL